MFKRNISNGAERWGVPFFVQVQGKVPDAVRCYGPLTVLEVDEDVTDRFTAKITLANGYHGGFVLVQDLDGFVDGFFDDKMDDFVVGLKNEGRSVLGLDDSVIVVL